MKKIYRLFQIHRGLHKSGLSIFLIANTKYNWVNRLLVLLPWLWFCKTTYKNDGKLVNLSSSFENLGTIFIKFGQLLSTRSDLIGQSLADELSKLQDNCQTFDTAIAIQIIEKELQNPISAIFKNFDQKPISAASIAQVYTATLLDGQEVVVKVVRPNIQKQIDFDLEVLVALIKLSNFFAYKQLKRLRLLEVADDFKNVLAKEMNMVSEGANGNLHRRNWLDSELLYVPKSYLDLTTKNVLVQERIYGIKIDNIDKIKAEGIDLKRLSENGVTIFFTQVFVNNFFHADMHPGNIMVLPNGKYTGVDFGIMGSLSKSDQMYLARNFLAFFNKDYYTLAELHIQSKWVDENTRVEDLTSAFRTVSEPIVDKPLKDISFGAFLIRTFEVARNFGMKVQPQLILLQKTILAIEGLGRKLDGDLDLVQTAKPILTKWLKQQFSYKTSLRELYKKSPIWLYQLPSLPEQVKAYCLQFQENQETLLAEVNKIKHANQKRNRILSLFALASTIAFGTVIAIAIF